MVDILSYTNITLSLTLSQLLCNCRSKSQILFLVLFDKKVDSLVKFSQYLFVRIVDTLFNILQSYSFLIHNFHIKVCRIGAMWNGKANILEVVD